MTTFALPDLRGVTMIGTGQGPGLSPEQLGVRDGASSVTLTLPELPPDLGGTSQPFSNYQPSLPVTYMICVEGIFPSRASASGLIGEVMPFAGNFVPTDYLPADGRLLQIADNTALFSLIGTTYGGDGVATFALPDLRGRTIIGASSAPLGPSLGETIGSPSVSLSNSQAPNGFGNFVQPFDNREPSLALNYVIALEGIFPSRSGNNVVDPDTPFLERSHGLCGQLRAPRLGVLQWPAFVDQSEYSLVRAPWHHLWRRWADHVRAAQSERPHRHRYGQRRYHRLAARRELSHRHRRGTSHCVCIVDIPTLGLRSRCRRLEQR
jgi:microcystin-dependent protein